jgi:hypothetical protein
VFDESDDKDRKQGGDFQVKRRRKKSFFLCDFVHLKTALGEIEEKEVLKMKGRLRGEREEGEGESEENKKSLVWWMFVVRDSERVEAEGRATKKYYCVCVFKTGEERTFFLCG